jgi:MFS family permease
MEAVYVVWMNEALLLTGAFVIGVAAQGSKICVDTIVQESIDDAFRGRVFSFYDVIFNIAFVSAAAFAALTLPADGNSKTVYAVVSAGYAVTAFAYGRVNRRRRTDEAPAPGTGQTRTATVE